MENRSKRQLSEAQNAGGEGGTCCQHGSCRCSVVELVDLLKVAIYSGFSQLGNGGSFHSYVNVYQRVSIIKTLQTQTIE